MIRFNAKGMMVFPCPNIDEEDEQSILVAEQCFCTEGHNLVDSKVKFKDFDGILLKVKSKDSSQTGLIALSPICGDKSRITLDIELEEGEMYDIYCPECDDKLPVYSDCTCGGSLVTLFNSPAKDYNDSFCVCNRVGCYKSVVNEVEDSFSTTKLQTRWNKYK
jgi:hypothetical protein